jgi:hypothetical protein
MNNHTPGPWAAAGSIVDGYRWDAPVVLGKDKQFVAAVYSRLGVEDACLIAAAPELLKALQDLLAQVEQYGHEPECGAARAAIAKAKGEAK